MTAPAPLTFPLAGLLADPPGERRQYPIHGATIPLADELRLTGPLEGGVDITRTNRGVLVHATLDATIAGECSRCLREIDVPVSVEIDEEVLPSVDLQSGTPVDTTAEPDVTRLNGHHELELAPLVSDAISLAEPIAPLCEASCPGLCPECGKRLDEHHAAHEEDAIDPRLEALRAFKVDASDESR
jgi:uncharacterized protein